MRTHYFLDYTLPFYLEELIAAVACVLLIFQIVSRKPDSFLAQVLRHSKRLWFAFGLFLLPRIIGQILLTWRIHHFNPGNAASPFYIAFEIFLPVFFGMFYGLVGCLLSAKEGKLDRGRALGVAVGLVAAVLAVGSVLGALVLRSYYVADIFLALGFLTFVIARQKIHTQGGSATGDAADVKKVPAIYALVLAFLPSAMLLLIWTALASGASSPSAQPPAGLFIACCLISIFCCFTASFMLFRRGTGLAILGGILFLFLNAFVSFLFGCGAILTNMKF